MMDQTPDCSDQQTQIQGHESGSVDPDVLHQAESQLKTDSATILAEGSTTSSNTCISTEGKKEECGEGSELLVAKCGTVGHSDGKFRTKHEKHTTETTMNITPNAFVGVRIPSDEIRAKIEEVQQMLLTKDQRLQPTFVATGKNHITLMVMRLDGQEEIERYNMKDTPSNLPISNKNI